MRILVTGSREWTDENLLAGVLLLLASRVPGSEEITIVHGGARGADVIANRIALHYEWEIEVHPADWTLGKGAGPKRNQEMVNAGADVCVAFLQRGAGNRGTKDCMGRAEAAGIPVVSYWSDGEAGVHEPRGDSPDSPPAGKPRVPGEGPGGVSADASADYAFPAGSYVGIGLSPLLVSLDCVHFYEVPDGTSIPDFFRRLEEIKT